jgi:DMSO/TMAO reductase YedYZ molybdopterin-dependent catalytic subunit
VKEIAMNRIDHPDRPDVALDGDAIVKDALALLVRRVAQPARRAFLQRSLTLGGVALLSGCSLTDGDSVDTALASLSRWNDRVQGALFDPGRLAPTYPDSMIARPFPFNAFYGEDEVREIDGEAWRLEVTGRVADKRAWSLAELRAMPQREQVTRHICVEGWSAIGKWGGVPFSAFLARVGADTRARYVGFQCDDGYHTSIDMASALHPQTLMVLTQDGQVLPARHGFPLKLRIPTKLGYKNPKHIRAVTITDTHPGGYWEDQGYNWFGGS